MECSVSWVAGNFNSIGCSPLPSSMYVPLVEGSTAITSIGNNERIINNGQITTTTRSTDGMSVTWKRTTRTQKLRNSLNGEDVGTFTSHGVDLCARARGISPDQPRRSSLVKRNLSSTTLVSYMSFFLFFVKLTENIEHPPYHCATPHSSYVRLAPKIRHIDWAPLPFENTAACTALVNCPNSY